MICNTSNSTLANQYTSTFHNILFLINYMIFVSNIIKYTDLIGGLQA